MDMDISMDIHAKSVDMDMDMDGKFHIHGNPGYYTPAQTHTIVNYRNHCSRVHGRGKTCTIFRTTTSLYASVMRRVR